MARFDRCSICDYTEEGGSDIIGVSPNRHGKVRWVGDNLLCATCKYEIDEATFDLKPPEEVDENW